MSYKLILNKDASESITEYGSIEQAFDVAATWIPKGYTARMTDEEGVVKYTQLLSDGLIATYPGDAFEEQDAYKPGSSQAPKPWWRFW